jgi:hypothetical protein
MQSRYDCGDPIEAHAVVDADSYANLSCEPTLRERACLAWTNWIGRT